MKFTCASTTLEKHVHWFNIIQLYPLYFTTTLTFIPDKAGFLKIFLGGNLHPPHLYFKNN